MKNHFSAVPNLDEVRRRLADDTKLAPARRAAICSAINVACRWMDLAPSMAPASVAFLNPRLARIEPTAVGATPKRFSTVKSELLFALRHLGLSGPGTYLVAMTPAWSTLWQRLPDKYARTAFSRLFRYCSGRRIAPDEVTDQVMDEFLEALRAETFIKDPRVGHQNACRIWNTMRGRVTGWPNIVLAVPRYADHYILPWSAFPTSFKADVDAYLANLAHDDILDLNAPPRRLKPRTIATYRYELRRFASMLVRRGHAPGRVTAVAYLVEPKHVEDGLRFLLARHGNKPLRSAFDLATLLGKAAKHWVKAPAETIAIIARYAKNVCPPAAGLGVKNRERLVPLRDEKNLARLFLLPGKIQKEVEGRGGRTREDSLLFQHAVALSILTYAPIRIGNLARLSIGNNLRWSGPDMTGALVIDIDGSDVKNAQTLSFPLPRECADLVRLYLKAHHSRLAVGANPFLFPSDLPERAKRADTLGKQLTRLIRRSIGLEVNPHLYRHLVHLVVLNRYSGAYAMVSRILGHRSLQTAISNYAGEDIAIAMRAFQGLVGDVIAGRTPPPTVSSVVFGLDAATRQSRR